MKLVFFALVAMGTIAAFAGANQRFITSSPLFMVPGTRNMCYKPFSSQALIMNGKAYLAFSVSQSKLSCSHTQWIIVSFFINVKKNLHTSTFSHFIPNIPFFYSRSVPMGVSSCIPTQGTSSETTCTPLSRHSMPPSATPTVQTAASCTVRPPTQWYWVKSRPSSMTWTSTPGPSFGSSTWTSTSWYASVYKYTCRRLREGLV